MTEKKMKLFRITYHETVTQVALIEASDEQEAYNVFHFQLSDPPGRVIRFMRTYSGEETAVEDCTNEKEVYEKHFKEWKEGKPELNRGAKFFMSIEEE